MIGYSARCCIQHSVRPGMHTCKCCTNHHCTKLLQCTTKPENSISEAKKTMSHDGRSHLVISHPDPVPLIDSMCVCRKSLSLCCDPPYLYDPPFIKLKPRSVFS